MKHFDWSRRILDVKPGSGGPGRCSKCRRPCASGERIRLTFAKLGHGGWFDKRVCESCGAAILKGRRFNVFAAEEVQ